MEQRAVTRRLIVAMTGATGTLIGVRLLQMLQETDVETHLVMSKWAARTLVHETSFTPEDVHGWRRACTRRPIRAPRSRADRF